MQDARDKRYNPEFEHVFEVHEDGSITDPPNLWAPGCYGGELEGGSTGWEFVSGGYTRQDSYNGPIMHASEQFAGGLYDDIMGTPGIYALVVSECDHSDPSWECETDDSGEFTGDCEPAGWAVVEYTADRD